MRTIHTEHLPSKCPNPLGMLAAFPIKIRPRATADCFGFILPTQVSLLIGHLTPKVPETSIKGTCAGPEPSDRSQQEWLDLTLPALHILLRITPGRKQFQHTLEEPTSCYGWTPGPCTCLASICPQTTPNPQPFFVALSLANLIFFIFFNVASNITFLCVSLGFQQRKAFWSQQSKFGIQKLTHPLRQALPVQPQVGL